MKREKMLTMLEAIEAGGYEIITFDASRLGRISLEIGVPALVNTKGIPVDPKTGEVIPHFL